MANADLKKQIEAYLKNLAVTIDQGSMVAGVKFQIKSEADLERFIRVGVEGETTLLGLLGYGDADIEDHQRNYIGTTQFIPDYVIRSGQNHPAAVLDLKGPSENVSDKQWAVEVVSYCKALSAPVGIVFNGKSIRVFVNTKLLALLKYQRYFDSLDSVASADPKSNTSVEAQSKAWTVAELLSLFCKNSFCKNALKRSKWLADRYVDEITVGTRRKYIRSILAGFLRLETQGDFQDVVKAMAGVGSLWITFDVKPSEAELTAAWQHSSIVLLPKPPRLQRDANPGLRRKVVAVCAAKGWQAIPNADIRGLNYRLDGIVENGYRPVPSGPGVPEGLCIQGVDGAKAMRITEELDRLLS